MERSIVPRPAFLFLSLIVATSNISTVAYAQEGDGLRNNIIEGELDVLLEPTWNENAQAVFKVSFLENGTSTPHPHIDYTFAILKNHEQLYNVNLHTASGIVSIPYNFSSNGDYSVDISVWGVTFVPRPLVTNSFPIKVIPEFTSGSLAGLAAVLMTLVLCASFVNRR